MKRIFVAPLVMTAFLAGAAHADSQMRVSFAGLDLDTADGATELLNRIQTAAHTLCDAWDGPDSESRNQCMTKAVRAAVKQINRPQVTLVAANRKP
jgi:UrcA family protein